MTLTEEHIDYIATNLEFYGVAPGDLQSDLLDHICTHIENSNVTDFDIAYQEAIQKLGGQHALRNIDRDTYLLTTFRKTIRRQKLVYILGFISFFTMTVGAVFKWQHWPAANIIAVSGMAMVTLFYLPLHFYQKYENYKRSVTR
jgi:hypothetical protein